MIFNSLDFMNSLALDRYAENFGNKYKLPAIAKRLLLQHDAQPSQSQTFKLYR